MDDDTQAVNAAVAQILLPPWQTVAAYCREECARQGKEPPPMYEHEDLFAVPSAGGWVLRGVYAGTPHIKQTAMRPDSPEHPDDPIEAARVLDAHAKAFANPLSIEATLAPVAVSVEDAMAQTFASAEQPDETPVSASEAEDSATEDLSHAVNSGADVASTEGAEGLGSADAGPSSGGLAVHDELGSEEPGYCDPEDVFDADFTEAGEPEELGAELAEDYPALTDEQIAAVAEEPPAAEPSSGVVYFGDDIHVARLAKMGRLLEIATEKKAGLQEGWTVQEFASLQNLIMRINRGEAPDDHAARERFDHISAYSRAMNAVDAYLAAREAELETFAKGLRWDATPEEREAARAAILAFNPEEWP